MHQSVKGCRKNTHNQTAARTNYTPRIPDYMHAIRFCPAKPEPPGSPRLAESHGQNGRIVDQVELGIGAESIGSQAELGRQFGYIFAHCANPIRSSYSAAGLLAGLRPGAGFGM